MRRLWTLAALAATAVMAATAMLAAAGGGGRMPLARTEMTPAVATLGIEDDGKSVQIAQGGKIVVHLPGEASGKVRWSRAPSPLGPLTVLDNRVDRTSRDGKVLSETYVFGYRAGAAGTATLQFVAAGAATPRTIAFTFKIVPSVLADRLADVNANAAHLAVGISFVGPQDKAFTDVFLATVNAQFKGDKKIVRLTGGDVRRLTDALADTGCLNQAVRYNAPITKAITTNQPTCVVTVLGNDGYMLHLELGWGPDALTRLDALAGALDSKTRSQVKTALAPLDAYRAEWSGQATKPSPATAPATQPH
ncbi:MAG: hypothetical protein NT031_14905 [Planctomycetota bacterium]|nr:hypothetical protein [Planctomycetota bacterium]